MLLPPGDTQAISTRQGPVLGPILIMEQDSSIRRALAQVLTDEGFDVRCAVDTDDATKVLMEELIRPSLVILDLWTAEVVGCGWGNLERCLSELGDTPLLVMRAEGALPRALKSLSRMRVLREPYGSVELLGTISSLIVR